MKKTSLLVTIKKGMIVNEGIVRQWIQEAVVQCDLAIKVIITAWAGGQTEAKDLAEFYSRDKEFYGECYVIDSLVMTR